FTSQLIFNRLAIHADSRRECDASELAKLYKAVELLAPQGDAWKGLTLGKVMDMLPLITRIDGTEDYAIFSAERADDAKALFVWACGDGINKPSREDIHNRVLELTDPKKYAEKQQKAAEKPADGARESADEEEPEAPDNLIATEVQTRPAPN